jgi:hypothetical protein
VSRVQLPPQRQQIKFSSKVSSVPQLQLLINKIGYVRITLRRVRSVFATVEKQYVLSILIVCLYSCTVICGQYGSTICVLHCHLWPVWLYHTCIALSSVASMALPYVYCTVICGQYGSTICVLHCHLWPVWLYHTCIALSSVAITALPYVYFSTLSHKRHDLRGKKFNEQKICVLVSSKTFT